MTHTTPRTSRAGAGLLLALCLFAPAAQAGLFSDDDARQAIIELRQRADKSDAQAQAKAADLAAQIEQLKRGLLDLNNQLEQLRGDNARLRGQNEQLARDLSDVQRQQKDMKSGIDDKFRKIEPQKVTLDGKTFNADPEEVQQYEAAMALLRKSDFAGAVTALTAFRQRYPGSGYGESALFWVGNAQFGLRQYKEAITSFRALVAAAPDGVKSPEAMLAIANCQAELKDSKAARRTIGELVKTYPKSEAAQAGRDRLATLK